MWVDGIPEPPDYKITAWAVLINFHFSLPTQRLIWQISVVSLEGNPETLRFKPWNQICKKYVSTSGMIQSFLDSLMSKTGRFLGFVHRSSNLSQREVDCCQMTNLHQPCWVIVWWETNDKSGNKFLIRPWMSSLNPTHIKQSNSESLLDPPPNFHALLLFQP